jgi:1-acyl-sn-glycerol-3-phosphate acyltransferase
MGAVGWLKSRVSKLVDARLGPDALSRSKALTVRKNEYGFDPFGFSPSAIRYALLIARFFYRDYFRTEVHGIENVPPGRALLVANHSGQLPWDGMVIASSVFFDAQPPRMARSMLERYVPTVPFASYLFSRWGQITGTPENCRRLLENEEIILVFPEGVRGVSKPFSKRYQLQGFGLGFMRLAMETNTPIVPVAVVGAEEQAPAINIKPLARLLSAPAFPVVPYPPFVAVWPLPVKYHLYFGEPLVFDGDHDDDDDVIEQKVRSVKHKIQSMIHLGLRERRGVFW